MNHQRIMENALAEATIWHEETDNWDEVLARLRGAGYRANVCVRVTQVLLGVVPRVAHGIVVDSDAWADHRDAMIEAQNALVDYIEVHGEAGTLEVEL